MYIAPDQTRSIEQQIAAIEAATGVQVLVALIGRCDAYPEMRWKAFALAVALAALTLVGADFLRPGWNLGLLDAVVTILAAGAANALLAHYVPAYGRRYVRRNRAEAECRDYARVLFLERSLFATPARTTVLILAGLFERVVVVHPDEGFEGRVDSGDWKRVVDAVTDLLARGERHAALQAGLQALSEMLARASFPAPDSAANTLPDRPIQERGA